MSRRGVGTSIKDRFSCHHPALTLCDRTELTVLRMGNRFKWMVERIQEDRGKGVGLQLFLFSRLQLIQI